MPATPDPEGSAVVTVAFGPSIEHLDHTFLSFADKNPSIPLHAFIVGKDLPARRCARIAYHLVPSVGDFAHPLREVWFRRLQLFEALPVKYVLAVDSYDVLCLQRLPPFAQLLGECALAGCVEHLGGRYTLGQGYISNFLNAGVIFWNVPASRQIREEIVARGRKQFRMAADDQLVLNEVVQTKYYDQLRILPCQYNYRAYLKRKCRGWPTVNHLDGVRIYHNAACTAAAKALGSVQPKATLQDLEPDGCPLSPRRQLWRRLKGRFRPWVVK